MKYQALKGLGMRLKSLGVFDTLEEAHKVIKVDGGIFRSFSFVGGFPTYSNEANNIYYQIHRKREGFGIVLGLNKEEKLIFDFDN